MQFVKISRKDLNFWFVSPQEFSTRPPSILNEFTTGESLHLAFVPYMCIFLCMQKFYRLWGCSSLAEHIQCSRMFTEGFFQLCSFKLLFIFIFFKWYWVSYMMKLPNSLQSSVLLQFAHSLFPHLFLFYFRSCYNKPNVCFTFSNHWDHCFFLTFVPGIKHKINT